MSAGTGMGAQQAAWVSGGFPPAEHVRPGMWSIPVDCNRFPVRFTYAYLLTNNEGEFVVVDPGWDSDLGWRQLLAGIRTAGLAREGLKGVAVTHFHRDHLGLASRLGAPVIMHAAEVRFLESRPDAAAELARDDRWLRAAGVPEGLFDTGTLTRRIDDLRAAVPSLVALEGGEFLPLPGRSVELLATPGHTAGHSCFLDHDNEIVFTGDHLLPRISPNIGLDSYDDSSRDSVVEYLASLAALLPYKSWEAAPGHEFRFRGIADRVQELSRRTERRRDEVAAILGTQSDATLWEVAERLSWSRPWASSDLDFVRGALSSTAAYVRTVL